MAFRRTPPTDSPTPAVPRLDDTARYAQLATFRRAFLEAKAERQRGLDILALEREQSRTTATHIGPAADLRRERLAKLRKMQPPPAPPPEDPEGLPPAAALAHRLLTGDAVEQPPDRAAKLERLRREFRIFEDGLRDIEGKLEEERDERTYEMAEVLLPKHQALLRAIYEQAAGLADAMQAERQFIADFLLSGYGGAEHILRRPGLDGASRLGSLDQVESQISLFRRRLEEQGVI